MDTDTHTSPTTTKPLKTPTIDSVPTAATATKNPSTPDRTGSADATLAETSDTTSKHASNNKRFMAWYIFLGILYLCTASWEMWRQKRADFHWKKMDEWFGEYGRNLQADGRTPVRYLLGHGKG